MKPAEQGPTQRRPTSMRRFVIVLCWGAWALSACGHAAKPRPYAAPDAETLMTALRERQDAVRALNLQTKTTSWLGGDRIKATVLMLVERSGRLRFEAEVSLKGTVAALTTDGAGGFALLDMERNVFREGPACPQNVASLVRIPLPPEAIAAILLGDAPVGPGARVVGLDWDAEVGAERLEMTSPSPDGRSQRLRVLMRKSSLGFDVLGVEGAAKDAHGRPGWWRVRYEGVTRHEGIAFPETIRFAEPGASFDDGVEIKVRDRRINPDIAAESFKLSPPPGALLEHVGCGAPLMTTP
ncbi:MAG: hypothetical protein KA712_01350 [Myxococcales bacterium]|nr:hypothetical protein [Myxococcales bacterium]